MAVCTACDQEMLQAESCTLEAYEGETESRVRYDPEWLSPWPEMPPDHRCHDCGVRPGAIHHPGCDMERCPKCEGQAISCDCNYEDEDDV